MKKHTEFRYDYMSRRVHEKKLLSGDGTGSSATTGTSTLVWADRNPISELNNPTTGNSITNFYTWGLDPETGLYYYGSRYLDAAWGRWASKDPIEELGGLNVYAFVLNAAVDRIDRLGEAGLAPFVCPVKKTTCCGADYSNHLKSNLIDAMRRYDNASRWSQFTGCLSAFTGTALGAWDMSFAGSEYEYDGTVTIGGSKDGQCHYSWEVNFALFGVLNQRCQHVVAMLFSSILAANPVTIGASQLNTAEQIRAIWTGDQKPGLMRAQVIAFLYTSGPKTVENAFRLNFNSVYGTPESLYEWNPTLAEWVAYGYAYAAGGNPSIPKCNPCLKEAQLSSRVAPLPDPNTVMPGQTLGVVAPRTWPWP